MTSQPIAEEFPATAETLAVPHQQKAGELALVQSLEHIPGQRESVEDFSGISMAKGEPANKYALSFLRVVTKGYELPDNITQNDAELFTESIIGMINEVRSRRGSRREADEPHRLFVRGYSDQEISTLLGNTRSKETLGVSRSLDVKTLHERGHKPRALHKMLKELVDVDAGKSISQLESEADSDSAIGNALQLVDLVRGSKEVPVGISADKIVAVAKRLVEVRDTLQKRHGKKPSRRTEQMDLFLTGLNTYEVADSLGMSQASVYNTVREFPDLLHKYGITSGMISNALIEFSTNPQADLADLIPIEDVPVRADEPRRTPGPKSTEIIDDTSFDEWNSYGVESSTGVELDEVVVAEERVQTTDLVRTYLTEIGRIDLLNAEQEVDLAKRIEVGLLAGHKLATLPEDISPELQKDLLWLQADGQRAKNHLVEANLRLVVSLAKRYQGKGLALLDLTQEGNLGLMRAVDKFDYTKGYKFSTYATWWIRQGLQRAIADQGRTIRVPVHMVEQINKALRVKRDLGNDLGREPTNAEVGEIMEVTADKVEEILGYGKEPVSINQRVGDSGDAELGDFIPDEDQKEAVDEIAFAQMQYKLTQVINTLPYRNKTVIEMRYGLADGHPRSVKEISEELGLTGGRISQIEAEVLREMRKPGSPFQQFKDYVQTA